MGFIQAIIKFFESLFKRTPSPEGQKKAVLKKIEAETKDFSPVIFKNGNLLPNFGEAIYNLYKNVRILDDLFSVTISPNDIPRQRRFEAQLVMTGYTSEDQDIITSLSYEARKEEIQAEDGDSKSETRVYERQHKRLEHIVKTLNTDLFKNMDKEILQLRQLVDFCHTNFIPVLQLFDPKFMPADFSYKPSYMEVSIEKLGTALEDFYYQAATLKITAGTANAVVALAQLKSGGEISDERAKRYTTALKRISYILRNILSPDKIKILIRYVKEEEEYEPRTVSYSGSPRNDFATMIQEQYKTNETRIKSELQDAQISRELSSLFGGSPLLPTGSYNNDENKNLQENSSLSFNMIFPMRILKTFVKTYLPDNILDLLNDLVIEGFFTNQSYKNTFSETVYSVLAIGETIEGFENSFGDDKPNSIAVLRGYLKDSHRDKDFYKKVEAMVNTINSEAKQLIQTETSTLFALYNMLVEVLADAKKPSGEIIENSKTTMLSSRHRDDSAFLDQTFPTWKIFFEIMKNYVIIINNVAQTS